MPQQPPLSRRDFSFPLIFQFIGFLVAISLILSDAPHTAAQTVFPQEALVDLIKPSVVRIAEHVSGTARIPEIKVDIRQHLVAVVPGVYTDVPVDEYLSGSGFVINPDGYVVTNAHVVSQETVKQGLASESALSALYENALFLSDQEMEEFLKSDGEESFVKQVLKYVIDHSLFDLKNDVAVLKPNSGKTKIADLIEEGFPATVVSVNDDFSDDERDVAILKIDETDLPALSLGNSDELTVGKRAFIFGFPATAEVNQNNPAEATFTQGVVSAIKQSSDKSFKIFQTDAKVSEGSSGGPLFNDRGEVVGIITFQTDQLNRVSGDNFAFALPIEIVSQIVKGAEVSLVEGSYGKNFRSGFAQFSDKHCDKALVLFQAAIRTNAAFGVSKYIEPYLKRCEALKQLGLSLDNGLDTLRGTVRTLGNPFFYLLGGGLFLLGIFGAAFFWLLRQVRREGQEIEALETRLYADETRIKGYNSLPKTKVTRPRRASSGVSRKGKKVI